MKDNIVLEYKKILSKKSNTINFSDYFKYSGKTYDSKIFKRKLTKLFKNDENTN